MGFLDKIFGGAKPASPEPKAIPIAFTQVAEIPCNDGYSMIVLGRDSTMGMSGQDCFVRRYPLLLKLPEGMTPDEFVQKHGGDKRSVQSDGTIAMIEIPGEAMIATDWLQHFTEDMKKYGIALPAEAIYDAMSEDMGKQGPKYLQPVSQVEALAHNKKEGRSPA